MNANEKFLLTSLSAVLESASDLEITFASGGSAYILLKGDKFTLIDEQGTPQAVLQLVSAGHDLPGAREVLEASKRGTEAGGQRGAGVIAREDANIPKAILDVLYTREK